MSHSKGGVFSRDHEEWQMRQQHKVCSKQSGRIEDAVVFVPVGGAKTGRRQVMEADRCRPAAGLFEVAR